jgi:aryl-alcohol dehydrogenase-like predicted oxidoreductase
METRSIGKLDASVVGLGCNNFGGRIDEAATQLVVSAALDAGITLFDTADIYGGTRSEEFLGRALGARRDEAIVATKFGGPIDEERKGGASAAYIARAVGDSLRRLGTDRIDLYQLHFPDANTPFEETLEALDALVTAGKVLEIGGSNFSAEQIDETARISRDRGFARFVSVQNEYSLLRRGPERFGVLDACEREGLAFIPYFPLASGVLTGKYRRHEAPPAGTRLAGMPAERVDDALSDKVFDRVEALDGFARDHGHTLGELAIAWLLARATVGSVIAGATKPEQARANAAAAAWKLTDADLTEIDALLAAAKTA